MQKLKDTIRFDSIASKPLKGLALICDLSGFSKFFNQPDVNEYVPKFINRISEVLSVNMFGGLAYWLKNPTTIGGLTPPIHEKFLGDGGMYLWRLSSTKDPKDLNIQILCNRLWHVQNRFPEILKKCYEEIPVVDLPQKIRFGLAAGTIYELQRKDNTQKEYIGFCINLASRLQKYCSDLGFIASARIGLSDSDLAKYEYIKVVAKQIKGFPREIVIVDKNEFEGLEKTLSASLFEKL